MAFNINEFLAYLDDGGVAKTSHFQVQIFAPEGDINQMRDMMYRADSVTMPGRSIGSTEHSFYGPTRKYGNDSLFKEVEITFILSEDLNEKLFFEEWQDLVVGPYRTGDTSDSAYDIGFYEDYVGSIIIRHFNDSGDMTFSKKLIEAYPIAVGDLERDWENGAQIMRLSVTFTYRFFLDEGE
jgi:hypothetical protein